MWDGSVSDHVRRCAGQWHIAICHRNHGSGNSGGIRWACSGFDDAGRGRSCRLRCDVGRPHQDPGDRGRHGATDRAGPGAVASGRPDRSGHARPARHGSAGHSDPALRRLGHHDHHRCHGPEPRADHRPRPGPLRRGSFCFRKPRQHRADAAGPAERAAVHGPTGAPDRGWCQSQGQRHPGDHPAGTGLPCDRPCNGRCRDRPPGRSGRRPAACFRIRRRTGPWYRCAVSHGIGAAWRWAICRAGIDPQLLAQRLLCWRRRRADPGRSRSGRPGDPLPSRDSA